MENKEVWLPVMGYESLYQVSSMGRVKSLERIRLDPIRGAKRYTEKILSPGKTKFGYCFVRLSLKNKPAKSYLIHRAVADAFLQNPENKPQVNHKNGVKSDNTITNLEWVTRSENVKHSFVSLGRKAAKNIRRYGKDNPLTKIVLIYKRGKLIGRAYGQREAAKIAMIPHGSVNTSIQRGREIRGFKFKYDRKAS